MQVYLVKVIPGKIKVGSCGFFSLPVEFLICYKWFNFDKAL